MKKRKCPVCRKLLKFNWDFKRWDCIKMKTGRDKKVGCGYKWKPFKY